MENMKQWLQDATPEQRQELERIKDTEEDTVEGINRMFDTKYPGLRQTPGWEESPQGKAAWAYLDASVLMGERLRALQSNPVTQGSPTHADFMRNILDEFAKIPLFADPSEVLATVQSPKIERAAINKSVKNALDARYESTRDIRTRALTWCDQWKATHPKVSNNKLAEYCAPHATKWNEEAGHHFGWGKTTDPEGGEVYDHEKAQQHAEDYIRGQLKPSKRNPKPRKRGALRV
ncbi:MAG: hypothetical protein ACYDD9_09440 [Acidithiobacillus sp.]